MCYRLFRAGAINGKNVQRDQVNPMPDLPEPICRTLFTDGAWRAVYESPGDRQYVIDDDGQGVYGVWYFPREADQPVIVEPETRA
jgi:hypothetical protein